MSGTRAKERPWTRSRIRRGSRFATFTSSRSRCSAAVCAVSASSAAITEPKPALMLAVAYERAFWLAAGVTVATGVSNLGMKGDGVLGPDTAWGAALFVKLTGVAFLLMRSLIRSDFVARCAAPTHQHSRRARAVLISLYRDPRVRDRFGVWRDSGVHDRRDWRTLLRGRRAVRGWRLPPGLLVDRVQSDMSANVKQVAEKPPTSFQFLTATPACAGAVVATSA
jgi:hypothetical protein